MISKSKTTEMFCAIDDFCIVFESALRQKLISDGKRTRNRKSIMSVSEVLTVTILFHSSGFRCFKHFYIGYVQTHLKSEFPNTVSYNRFVELMQANVLALTLYLKTCCLGKCSGISFVDSTPIRACKNKRIKANKVFDV